jgi:sec-independent protein translocase protein TatA
MFGGIGIPELVIILIILLLLFGPSRLGDLGSALGKGIKGFKRAMREPDEIDVTPKKEEAKNLPGSTLESANTPSKQEGAQKSD